MTYEDLFLAAFAVGFGLCLAKEFFTLLSEWINTPQQDRKKLRYILSGILLFAVLLYFAYILSSRQLF